MSESWHPKLFGKQFEIYNSNRRIVLADGSRLSGKTVGVCHKVMRHMTETPGARVGAFAVSIKSAKDAGSWQLLHDTIIPEWLEAGLVSENGMPIQYLTHNAEGEPGPKVDANTRTAYFRWRNWYGGSSELQLFSVDDINAIAGKVKQKSFSLIWLMELTTWKDIRILEYTMPCLRMKHLTPFDGTNLNRHQLLADTNPDEELGAESWVYKLFYTLRRNPPLDDSPSSVRVRRWLESIQVIFMHHSDNPFATQQQIDDLWVLSHKEPGLMDSHFHGIWGAGSSKKELHFANFFVKSKHIVGGGDDEGDQIDVSKTTVRLYGGWDLGNVNHAAVIMEKTLRLINGREIACWNVLDELVHIGEEIMLDEFTLSFMEKMEALDKLWSKKFDYIHWSDDSAINVFRPTTGSYDYVSVLAASKGKIQLQGVAKPNGSQRIRIRMLRQLLREDRLHISSRCVNTIAMFGHLKKNEKDYIVRDQYVHVFDALSYVAFAEGQEELMDEIFRPEATKHIDSGIVSV